jgi:hypothetical protein
MSVVSHQPAISVRKPSQLTALVESTQLWASIAIVAMWVAVLFVGVYGADITVNGGGLTGGGGTSVPSVIVVSLFAFLATGATAKYGYGRQNQRG